MLEVKMRSVTVRERDLSDAVKNGGKVCKNEKTQKFTQRGMVTASYGNITVCAPDARSARMDLAERVALSRHHLCTPSEIKAILS